MPGYFDRMLLVADTTLWNANNAHLDVLAESVFYKLGGCTLAAAVNDTDPGDGGKAVPIPKVPAFNY